MASLAFVVLAALVLVSAHDVVRRPTLRRVALRNVLRRPAESALVLTGSLLGAAIITSAFLVGDTLRSSLRDVARAQLGPVDEVVHVPPGREAEVAARLRGLPGIDGVLPATRVAAAVSTVEATPRAEPKAELVAIVFPAARRFGGEPRATGLTGAGPTPGPGEAVIGADLARDLAVGPGARIVVHTQGRPLRLRVRGVLPKRGLAGLWLDEGTRSPNVFVAPSALASLGRAGSGAPPEAIVLVSNRGGVLSGVGGTDPVEAAIRTRLGPSPGVGITRAKRVLLDRADAAGRVFTDVFSAIGAVSVIAGVLLLLNVFVMLADERKPQLGTFRAMGLKRNQLVRAFGIEGAVYGVLGAALGALAGIALGRLVVMAAEGIFRGSDESSLTLHFSAPSGSVIGGFVLGAAISVATVWLTSLRIARLNIIRAIRGQPEPPRRGRPALELAAATVGFLAGAALFGVGVTTHAWVGALFGPALVVLSCVPLAERVVARRWAVTGACVAILVWGLVSVSALPASFTGVAPFIGQGVLMVAAAVALLTVNAHYWVRLTDHLAGTPRGLAARLGLAYPLARPFRTAILLGMYALIVFTIFFLSLLSDAFTRQGPHYAARAGAGYYDMVVDSSAGNPVAAATLRAQPEVAAVAPLVRGVPEFAVAWHPEPTPWPLTGFGPAYIAHSVPALTDRDPRFPSDRAAFRAVLRSRSLAIVPDWFLQTGGGPPAHVAKVGERLTVRDPASGVVHTLVVAGVMSGDYLLGGPLVGAATARSVLGTTTAPSRMLVRSRSGIDPGRAGPALTGRLVEHGVDARSIREVVDRQLAASRSFFTLSEGYIAIGLLIGIAGLGVVMVRAVRERRREIGMLRAMGVGSGLVRSAFVMESGFVAARGVAIGAGLSLLTTFELMAFSDSFGTDRLHFGVPWAELVVIVALTLGASLLAVLAPAAQAARIRPAVALRSD